LNIISKIAATGVAGFPNKATTTPQGTNIVKQSGSANTGSSTGGSSYTDILPSYNEFGYSQKNGMLLFVFVKKKIGSKFKLRYIL
jgi:hypothetical protein